MCWFISILAYILSFKHQIDFSFCIYSWHRKIEKKKPFRNKYNLPNDHGPGRKMISIMTVKYSKYISCLNLFVNCI